MDAFLGLLGPSNLEVSLAETPETEKKVQTFSRPLQQHLDKKNTKFGVIAGLEQWVISSHGPSLADCVTLCTTQPVLTLPHVALLFKKLA